MEMLKQEDKRVGEGDGDEEVYAGAASVMKLHTTALDEVVSVNSFFTAAVFIGLSLDASHQTSLVSGHCEAGPAIARNLVVNEVVAFSCYLLSTLIAQGLKLQMTLSTLSNRRRKRQHIQQQQQQQQHVHRGGIARVNNTLSHIYEMEHLSPHLLRLGMMLSALGSIVGTIFLMLSMVSVIQLRLGLLGCGNDLTIKATIPLVTLVSLGVLSFISPVLYAVIW